MAKRASPDPHATLEDVPSFAEGRRNDHFKPQIQGTRTKSSALELPSVRPNEARGEGAILARRERSPEEATQVQTDAEAVERPIRQREPQLQHSFEAFSRALEEAEIFAHRLEIELERRQGLEDVLRAALADARLREDRTRTADSEQTIVELQKRVGELEEIRGQAEQRRRAAEVALAESERQAQAHALALERLEAEVAALREERERILGSTTWKLTAFPRRMLRVLRKGRTAD